VIDKARNELDYRPRVLVDEGIYRALVWYHHNQTAEAA
jgi:nucleoside-diphosphate-sugar epimerase